MSEGIITFIDENDAVLASMVLDGDDNLLIKAEGQNNVIMPGIVAADGTVFNRFENRDNMFLAQIETNNGVNLSGGGWRTLPYNVERFNSISGASFNTSTHTLTLPEGEYYFDCFHRTYATNDTNLRLYDPTNTTEIKQGSMAYGNESAPMTLKAIMTFNTTQDLVMQVYPRSSTSWGAGVVRDNNVPTINTPFAGKFYVERIG
jgi:hypothetical protein